MPETWTSYSNRVEDSNWRSCFMAARKAGFNREKAETCDNGELNCSTCPWKKITPSTQGGEKPDN